jgi:hypothetical protein
MIGTVMDKLAIKLLEVATRLHIIDSYSPTLDTTALERLKNRKPNAQELENKEKEVANAR